MSYIGTEPKDIRSFGRTKFDYTASQGQTAFTGADDDGKVLAFTTGQIEVYVNGILMDDSDFTTTGTGTVTLASAANLNDVVNIVSFESNIPDNDYVPASGGTFSGNVTHSGTVTNSSTTTMSGDLTVDTNTLHADAADNRVGIGTTTPAHKLDIVESADAFAARITNNSDGSQGLQVRTSDNDTGQYILDLQTSSSATGTNYASQFVVAKSGKVGIGTTAPTNQLTVTDGTATPYGADDEILVDIKRATTNTAANKATSIRLANNSNGARLSYGGTSDTMNIIMGSGNATATFRNDGGMTLPYQPMFDAYLTANSSHSAGNYNMSTGDSWATRTNVGSHFSSGTFTAPVAGKYLFCAAINGGHPTGAMTYFSCEFQVNGGRRYIHWFGKGGSASSYMAANNTAIISLAASDYVRLHTEKSHGVTVIGGAAYTHWCGMLIG